MSEYVRLFDLVKRHIDELDHLGLLSGGAPADEYDLESRQIARAVTAATSPEDIAETIAKVFAANFSASDSPEAFLETARKIKSDLT